MMGEVGRCSYLFVAVSYLSVEDGHNRAPHSSSVYFCTLPLFRLNIYRSRGSGEALLHSARIYALQTEKKLLRLALSYMG